MQVKSKIECLPSGDYFSKIVKDDQTGKFIFNHSEYSRLKYHHLYFVTDDDIREGDYYMQYSVGSDLKTIIPNGVKIADSEVSTEWSNPTYKDYNKRIIASTNDYLGLAQPSNKFMHKYCDCNGEIDEVLVEYTLNQHKFMMTALTDRVVEYIPQVASNNTITIRPIKNSWTKEELPIDAIVSLLSSLDTPIYRQKLSNLQMISVRELQEWLTKNDIV